MFRPWEMCLTAAVDAEESQQMKNTHVNLKWVMDYLEHRVYPASIPDKGSRANFRRCCRPFTVKDGVLYYKKTMAKVIITPEERTQIIKLVHDGADSSLEASALSSHHGRDATQNLLKKRYFWPSMLKDVREYIKQCDACQKTNPATLKVIPDLQSVSIPKQVFKQIGVDIMTLPVVDDMKYVVVAIDYFSKWSEARALPDKSSESVARFLYDDIICRHGCPLIHITDQGREFLNKLISELFRLTGTKQRVTSAYHPQANGLVERQNRTIKNCFLKVLQDNSNKWPYILQGVLFAHRTTKHTSTNFSPFQVLYQREPILPVDVCNLKSTDEGTIISEDLSTISDDDVFDKVAFNKTFEKMLNMRSIMEDKVHTNIEKAQIRQRVSYNKRHKTDDLFNVNDKVLLRNLKRDDRKGGWSALPWKPKIGYYIIDSINSNKTCVLMYKGKVMKTRQHLSNLKHYFDKDIQLTDDIVDANVDDIVEIPGNAYQNVVSRYYNPVSYVWQKMQCRYFNLTIKHFHKLSSVPKDMNKPSTTIEIIGDGNCFYRALSWWITGEEDSHTVIRKELEKFVLNDEQVIKFIGGQTQMEDYLITNPIGKNAIWATEVELFAAALMMNTTIMVYTFSNKQDWQVFHKSGRIPDTFNKHEKCVYLVNSNSNHFNVVTSVEDTM